MSQDELQALHAKYLRKLSAVDMTFRRYLYDQINWEVRMIGIKGARGVGKTTLLLQRIKLAFADPNEAFYVSLDDFWFQSHTLDELAQWLNSRGVMHLFLDEVHKYPKWSQTLKNLYDDYPEMRIVYTGSSMLEIDHSKADLSRRQTLYTLNVLSFREFLAFEGVLQMPALTLEEVLKNHVVKAMEITKEIKVMRYFEDYLRRGCYPFYKESGDDFLLRLDETAKVVMEMDLPAVEEVTYQTIQKAKSLLMIIAKNVPLEPNIQTLVNELETTRDLCLKLLYALDRAGLLLLLTDEPKSYKHLVKPRKIFLGNPNLMHAFATSIEVGTMRETFFLNQVGAMAEVVMPKQGDFKVNGRYLFEVGGSGKSFDQIADVPDSYLAVDDIETGCGNRIPLWMFGMLY
ncbi:MAG: ATP-binding protein [Bacteroidales bacterium]|nr:ATP-binding protein [Bacteroidales bacterium]